MMFRKKMLAAVVVLAMTAGGIGGLMAWPTGARADTRITGQYVEARTAVVLAGACHYNGELVTTGNDAVMAWHFKDGTFNGVSLKGVRAVAAVNSEKSLGWEDGVRRTELVVDAGASDAQMNAVAGLLKARNSKELGQIVSVRRTSISFVHGETGYEVSAAGFANMSVSYRADATCCIQPNTVWYTPLTPLENRKVGYTEVAQYTGSETMRWERHGEDSAFYGTFSF